LKTQDDRKVHKKNFFLEMSKRMCKAEFATFSWDRRGFGKSQGTPGDYFTEVLDARAALDTLCSQKNFVDENRVAVFGQSAGVYVASLLAKEDKRPGAFILSGGLYSDYKDMMSFNYHRVRDYAKKSPENLKWVEKNDLWGLAMGINLDRMFTAIEKGEKEFTIEYHGRTWSVPLNHKVYSSEFAPKNQFRNIESSVLIIHGEADLNVPLQDAREIQKELRAWGNNDVKLVIISDADHSFQETAKDEDTRLRERMSLDSFKRPYKEEYFQIMIDYLKRRFAYES
jgi:pimeloyl-ACP methyl ester carboxylesterase